MNVKGITYYLLVTELRAERGDIQEIRGCPETRVPITSSLWASVSSSQMQDLAWLAAATLPALPSRL